jgi:phospholipid/cholesterol/gamma-HCH transport system ATP-binding protein
MGVLVQLIRLLNDALGLTSVLVSHDISEALSICDHAIIIADGRVIGAGAPAELKAMDSPLVNQFINGLPDGPVPFHFPAGDYAQDLLTNS